jgi:hypothetical protein
VEFGTFLLLQSPSADAPDAVYRRGIEITQAAEDLGFNCSFWFGDLTQDQVLRSMRLFSQEVMPAFR